VHATRAVAALDNTVVRVEPTSLYPPVLLNAGERIDIQTDASFRISASSPLVVAQFMVGQGSSREVSGDPAMVLEVPSQQFRSRYDFLVPSTYQRNFLDVVAPQGSHPLLDGAALGGESDRVGPWDVIHVEVRPGAHRLTTSEGVPLGVKVSGTAPYTSYMYPGGLDLRLLTPG
ncbi:MAG: IgGFc-binding protein, partial [Polyangiales bacterium]